MIDSTGRIVLVNREIERLFGYARQDLLGQRVEMLVPARLRSRDLQDLSQFLAAPRLRALGAGLELHGLRRDGREFPVEIGLNTVDSDAGRFVVCSVIDITARKRAEQEHHQLEDRLRQVQKIEALSILAGGIAHDFLDILNAISSHGKPLGSEVRSEQGNQDLAELLQAADRGRDLVERILAYSLRQEAVRRAMPLGSAVTEAVKRLRVVVPASIEIRLDLQEVPRVLADEASVHQIVMHLGANAAQAMPDGGHLDVSLAPLYVRGSMALTNPRLHEGAYAVLAVRDNGEGMGSTVKERLFEPSLTTRPIDSGTGLGLAIVHAIMKDHEGAVLLESDPDKGTTYRCFFPAIPAESADLERPSPRVPRGHGEHVLFVEDEVALARVGERRLSMLGYRVSTAVSSAAARAAFLANPADFDLVVTDYTLAGASGLDLAREFTRVRPGLPIVMATGYIDDFPPDAMSGAGIRRLLMKPIGMQELGRVVADLLAQGSQDSPTR